MTPTVFKNYRCDILNGFVGAVKIYHGASVEYRVCETTRKNKLIALEDAKRMITKLRKK